MHRLVRLITLVAVVLASLLPFVLMPTTVDAQECSRAGDGAPEEIAQRFRDAVAAAPVDLGDPVEGEYGCVHPWNGDGPLTQTFDGSDGITNLMYQELHDAVYRLYGDWLDKYEERGGPDVFGAPTDNPHDAGPEGVEQYFEGGAAGRTGFFRRSEGESVYVVQGAILKRYVQADGTSGRLGAPISDEYGYPGGMRSNFDGGFILCCDDGSRVFLNDSGDFSSDCTQANHYVRSGSFNVRQRDDSVTRIDKQGTIDVTARFEVYFSKTDCDAHQDGAEYRIDRITLWLEKPPVSGLTYYWQSVSFGRYAGGKDVGDPDTYNVGCIELQSQATDVFVPVDWHRADWVVAISPESDTMQVKVTNKELYNVEYPVAPCGTQVGLSSNGDADLRPAVES